MYNKNPNTTYPPYNLLFNAFKLTPFTSLKIVIIGQDPYHQKGQAHGLAFSVQENIKAPPSLKNIYKAIKHDYPEFIIPNSGDLTKWAVQGVLLLNTILSVQEGSPLIHNKQGWETFTDEVVRQIDKTQQGIIFLLWGVPAQKIERLISNKQFILKSVHPSPLSAHRGFLDCGHFKKANQILISQNKQPIDWNL